MSGVGCLGDSEGSLEFVFLLQFARSHVRRLDGHLGGTSVLVRLLLLLLPHTMRDIVRDPSSTHKI